jgi:hypothetical protein
VIVATANDGNGGIDTDTATVTYTGPTGVTGSWGVAPGSASCTVPDGDSSCSISRSGIAKKTASVTFASTTGTVVQIFKP